MISALCEICQKLAVDALHQDFKNWRLVDHDVNASLELDFKDYEAANHSSEQGCEFCTFLLPAFESFQDDPYYHLTTHSVLSCMLSKRDADQPKSVLDLCAYAPWGLHQYLCNFEIRQQIDDCETEFFLSSSASTLPYTTATRSDAPCCIALAKHWLNECSLTHINCRRVNDTSLPTRLLQVDATGDSDHIKLVDTNGAKGRYVSLSYCWGKDQPVVTTKELLHQHKQGIMLSRLPETIRDAILITRRMGFSYLWIDALCIIQDDQEDWAREAANMCAVYEFAALSLSILDSPSSKCGFLKDRNPMTYAMGQADGTTVCLRQPEGHLSARPLHAGDVLETRAWTLQERVLATSVLHFGRDRIFWECSDGSAFESHTQIYEAQSGESDTYFGRSVHDMKNQLRQQGGTDVKLWHDLIENYTERQLTKSSDRLPALQGLATKFQQSTNETYLFGLWSQSLHLGLLWSCDGANGQASTLNSNVPSWSWASLEVQVRFMLKLNTHVNERAYVPRLRIELVQNNTALQLEGKYQANFCLRESRTMNHCTFANPTSRNLLDSIKVTLDHIDSHVRKGSLVEKDLFCLLVGERASNVETTERYFLIIEAVSDSKYDLDGTRIFRRAGVGKQEIWNSHGTGILSFVPEVGIGAPIEGKLILI